MMNGILTKLLMGLLAMFVMSMMGGCTYDFALKARTPTIHIDPPTSEHEAVIEATATGGVDSLPTPAD